MCFAYILTCMPYKRSYSMLRQLEQLFSHLWWFVSYPSIKRCSSPTVSNQASKTSSTYFLFISSTRSIVGATRRSFDFGFYGVINRAPDGNRPMIQRIKVHHRLVEWRSLRNGIYFGMLQHLPESTSKSLESWRSSSWWTALGFPCRRSSWRADGRVAHFATQLNRFLP